MGLVPVYQYRNGMTGYLRFFYTTQSPMDGSSFNSVPQDDLQNWSHNTPDGIAFYGCESTDPGAVPVYQYYAPVTYSGGPSDTQKYFYTLNQGQAGEGWYESSTTPAFYVFAAPDCGLAQIGFWYDANPGDPGSNFFLGCLPQTVVTGNFLAPSGWLPVQWAIGQGQGSQPFYALPGAAQLAYSVEELDLPAFSGGGTPQMAGSQVISNNSKYATVAQNVSYSMSITSTFTFSFTETLSTSAAVSMDVGFPGIGDAKTTFTLSVSLSATQSKTTSTAQTVGISSTVSVPPSKCVQVDGIVYVATDVPVPITLNVIVSAESNGVALTPPNPAGPCTALGDLFWQQNPSFTGSATADPSQGGILALLNGSVACSFGVSTELVVTDVDCSGSSERVEAAKAAVKLAKA